MKARISAIILLSLFTIACNLLSLSSLRSDNDEASSSASRHIAYWRFIWLDSGLPEDDMIEIFPQAVLDRVQSDVPASDDAAENIRTALQLIIDNPDDRLWETEGMVIDDVLVNGSAASVNLSGDIMVVGGAVFSGTTFQLAITIFEEPGIETALITFNGENITNLLIDHPDQARPEDFVYERSSYADYLDTP